MPTLSFACVLETFLCSLHPGQAPVDWPCPWITGAGSCLPGAALSPARPRTSLHPAGMYPETQSPGSPVSGLCPRPFLILALQCWFFPGCSALNTAWTHGCFCHLGLETFPVVGSVAEARGMVAKPHTTVSWDTHLQPPIPRPTAMTKGEGAAHRSPRWGRKSTPDVGLHQPLLSDSHVTAGLRNGTAPHSPPASKLSYHRNTTAQGPNVGALLPGPKGHERLQMTLTGKQLQAQDTGDPQVAHQHQAASPPAAQMPGCKQDHRAHPGVGLEGAVQRKHHRKWSLDYPKGSKK